MKEEENYANEVAEEAPKPSKTPKNFTVSDKDQEEIAKGYDNDGPFGIGMIKGVK